MRDYDPTDERPTLRCFYPPREKVITEEQTLQLRILDLEDQLRTREDELIDLLSGINEEA